MPVWHRICEMRTSGSGLRTGIVNRPGKGGGGVRPPSNRESPFVRLIAAARRVTSATTLDNISSPSGALGHDAWNVRKPCIAVDVERTFGTTTTPSNIGSSFCCRSLPSACGCPAGSAWCSVPRSCATSATGRFGTTDPYRSPFAGDTTCAATTKGTSNGILENAPNGLLDHDNGDCVCRTLRCWRGLRNPLDLATGSQARRRGAEARRIRRRRSRAKSVTAASLRT